MTTPEKSASTNYFILFGLSTKTFFFALLKKFLRAFFFLLEISFCNFFLLHQEVHFWRKKKFFVCSLVPFFAVRQTLFCKMGHSNNIRHTIVGGYRSQSNKNLISSFFRFLLLSLSVCIIRKYCLCYKMSKLYSEKQKNLCFMKKNVW